MNENTKKDLELYIHIPFCVRKCNYCDFLSFESDEEARRNYVRALCNEIEFYGQNIPEEYEISTIFVGGGTPSILETPLMTEVFEKIYNTFSIKKDAEITIECNPGTVGSEKLAVYKQLGVNRISFGLQSANNDELKLLGRIHTFENFISSYESALKIGIDNINIDVMYGLPKQTIKNLRYTFFKVLMLKPKHISCYSLIIEEGTKFYSTYKEESLRQRQGLNTFILPTEDLLVEMTSFINAILKERSIYQYEISNYARRGYECKHNIGYWKRVPYIGLGLGASSLFEGSRFKNVTSMRDYISAWSNANVDIKTLYSEVENLSRDEQMSEFMILGMRMNQGVNKADFYNCFNANLDVIFEKELQSLVNQGLVVGDYEGYKPTRRGLELQNVIAEMFI